MTVKQFFKSNAFKCIITLLCVLLISGIFLTVANGFLAVSDADRENSAIDKIYGGSAKVEKELEVADYNDDAAIEKGYLMDDGNYLIKSKGKGGYSNGTVTCWVVVKITDGAVSGVGKVVIDSQTGQTLMNQYSNESILSVFESNYTGEPYSASVITGATAVQTNNAIKNSVNGAVDFVKAQLGDVWDDPFEGFNFFFSDIIDHKSSTYTSNDDGTVTFSLVTKGFGYAGAFTASVTVNSQKTIENYVLEVDGSTSGWGTRLPEPVKNGTMFEGKDLKFFTDTYGSFMLEKPVESFDDNSVTTGATTDNIASLSTYQCFYMGAYAVANFDAAANKLSEEA